MEKSLTEFAPQERCRDGYRADCRRCACDRSKAYYQEHKTRIREGLKAWRRDNRAASRKQSWDYYSRTTPRARRLLRLAQERAKKTRREFDLDLAFVEQRLIAGKCEATGIAFELGKDTPYRWRHPFAPSLDRIDSRRGYTKDNVRMVVFIHNAACGDWGEEFVRQYARTLLDR